MDQLQTYRFAPVVNVFVGQRWKIFAYEWDLQINISKLHCLPAVKMLSRMWARRWIKQWSLWRMASAKPNLRLPSQPQGITAPWPVPNYTALWEAHVCEQLAQGCYLKVERPGVKHATFCVASQHPDHYATRLTPPNPWSWTIFCLKTAPNFVSWFSGKLLKLLPSDVTL